MPQDASDLKIARRVEHIAVRNINQSAGQTAAWEQLEIADERLARHRFRQPAPVALPCVSRAKTPTMRAANSCACHCLCVNHPADGKCRICLETTLKAGKSPLRGG
jgi:hypothetical protein